MSLVTFNHLYLNFNVIDMFMYHEKARITDYGSNEGVHELITMTTFEGEYNFLANGAKSYKEAILGNVLSENNRLQQDY